MKKCSDFIRIGNSHYPDLFSNATPYHMTRAFYLVPRIAWVISSALHNVLYPVRSIEALSFRNHLVVFSAPPSIRLERIVNNAHAADILSCAQLAARPLVRLSLFLSLSAFLYPIKFLENSKIDFINLSWPLFQIYLFDILFLKKKLLHCEITFVPSNILFMQHLFVIRWVRVSALLCPTVLNSISRRWLLRNQCSSPTRSRLFLNQFIERVW